MTRSALRNLQEELSKSHHYASQSLGMLRRSKRRPMAAMARYSVAHNPAAVAGGAAAGAEMAGLGVNMLQLWSDNNGADIYWDLQRMEGTFHPKYPRWSDKERALYAKSKFKRKQVTIDGPRVSNPFGVKTYSELKFDFQYNGYLIGEINVTPGKRNDPPGFGLKVEGRIVKNQNAAGDVAEVFYQVTYTFTRAIGQDWYWEGEFRISADGTFAQKKGQWVQNRSFPSPFSATGKPSVEDVDPDSLRIVEGSPPLPEWLLEQEQRGRQGLSAGQSADMAIERQTLRVQDLGMAAPLLRALSARSWTHYFPFPDGTEFEVDGPLTYNGKGKLHKADDKALKFELNMPAKSIFGRQIPKADLLFDLSYSREGAGNTIRARVNGTDYNDDNATITSNNKSRTIKPSVTVENKPIVLTITPLDDEEVRLNLMWGDDDYEFDCER